MSIADAQNRRLRVMGTLATLYLALIGAVTWLWLRWYGVEASPGIAVVCALPAVLGAVLARTSTADQRQYVARVLACMMFTPALLLFWATSLDPEAGAIARPVWPFATGLIVAHVLCFVGTIFWGGSALTAVPPSPGAHRVSATQLRARLSSLNAAAAAFEVASGPKSADPIIVSYRYDPATPRSHQVLLTLDSKRHEVRVRERVGVAGDRPANAEEASMRMPGSPFFDPTRPSADRVWSNTAQTTQLESSRLAEVPLRFSGDTAVLPADYLTALDGEGMVTLLCVLVTRSGWRWQPVFFARGD